ncbi:MAG: NAD-dependent epimerase/dehydratase family protein [Rhizomicrobium sp.]
MTETVLVTGGSGFIGGWCIAELLKRGYAVRTTLRSLAKEPALRSAVAAAGASGDRLNVHVADLTRDAGWDDAMRGCDYVLHVASPLGTGVSDDPGAFVAAARDGALRVLAAAVKAGVRRVVMTSAAATARPPLDVSNASDETVWADPDDRQFDSYRRSKILAERAAWAFMAGKPTAFTTILPGAVFGPVLTKESLGSVGVIAGLLHGRPPGIPRIGFWIVDVRDLADLHIRAMLAPQAAGERFLAAGDFLWMAQIAATLRAALAARGAKIPARRLPDFAVRVLALFVARLRMIRPLLGVKTDLSTAKARRMLGFAPRPATQTVLDCARSLLAGKTV